MAKKRTNPIREAAANLATKKDRDWMAKLKAESPETYDLVSTEINEYLDGKLKEHYGHDRHLAKSILEFLRERGLAKLKDDQMIRSTINKWRDRRGKK